MHVNVLKKKTILHEFVFFKVAKSTEILLIIIHKVLLCKICQSIPSESSGLVGIFMVLLSLYCYCCCLVNCCTESENIHLFTK